MTRAQLVQQLAATFDQLAAAAGLVQPTAEWGAYQLAADTALGQMGLTDDSLTDDTQIGALSSSGLWTLAQYYTLQQVARAFALKVDVSVQNGGGTGVRKSYSQLYKQVNEQLALLREDAVKLGVLDAFELGKLQLDILEPMQGVQPSGWWY